MKYSNLLLRTFLGTALLSFFALPAHAETRPVFLELFTSQGCSSCPAADALLKELASRSDVIPLSYHVHYWDYLGWKDPYASEENTERQRAYAHEHNGSLFTPELVIDGRLSVVGSETQSVNDGIERIEKKLPFLPVSIVSDSKKNQLHIHIAGKTSTKEIPMPETATVWAMYYKRNSITDVKAGENNGRTLESINSVVRIRQLGTWQQADLDYDLPASDSHNDGIAVIVQQGTSGFIIGGANYPK